MPVPIQQDRVDKLLIPNSDCMQMKANRFIMGASRNVPAYLSSTEPRVSLLLTLPRALKQWEIRG